MRLRAEGKVIGVVPTMGALHAGHRSLIRRACRTTDAVIVSRFVNPIQFGPGEDLRRYPRTPAADARVCRAEGVNWLFTPSASEMYPPGFETVVEVTRLGRLLCGRVRPGHFRGVATVVLKLFWLTLPHRAFFGQKDYQQAIVIKRMIQDLQMPVRIIVCPTVREPDGLACSSRNRYLSPAERRAAPALFTALQMGEATICGGERSARKIVAAMRRWLAQAGSRLRVDYVAIVDPETLTPLTIVSEPPVLLMGAVWVGATRLIDNILLEKWRGAPPTARTSRSGTR